jgi:hypothetical protein
MQARFHNLYIGIVMTSLIQVKPCIRLRSDQVIFVLRVECIKMLARKIVRQFNCAYTESHLLDIMRELVREHSHMVLDVRSGAIYYLYA